MNEPAQQPSSSISNNPGSWRSALIGGIAGALGTTIVGLVFSSTTLTFLSNLFANNKLPPDAVIFVAGNDCGAVGNGWKRFDQAQGRFLIGAGMNPDYNKHFQSGLTGIGQFNIKIDEKNLPPENVTIPYVVSNFDAHNGGYATMRDLAAQGGDAVRQYNLALGGQSMPVDITPPWIALTACRKS